jgi:hypothetical protein
MVLVAMVPVVVVMGGVAVMVLIREGVVTRKETVIAVAAVTMRETF